MTRTRPAPMVPLGLSGRAIAPDLARGAMLLLIAIANAPVYLWDEPAPLTSAHPLDASLADRIVQSLAIIAIDSRTYPMFAFLFGYGIVQLYRRQREAGADRRRARRLLRRRHWWMIAFGAVHAGLLWMGDILGAYGLAGLLLTWLFLDRRDATLRVWATVLTTLLALASILMAVGGALLATIPEDTLLGPEEFSLHGPNAETDYGASVIARLGFWAFLAPGQGVLGLVTPIAILLAFLAARHRVLEEPERHHLLLRRVAIGGIACGWTVGAVVAAQNAGLLGIPRAVDWVFFGVNALAGLACALGYVAVFGLVAAHVRDRPVGALSGALQAVGKRSLSCYLAQSIVFAPLMSAWGLGVGAHLSSWSIALVAVATWLLTVVLAVLLERAGRRGPAEWALRRLAYPSSR
ncbi:putative membrane protein YeiB [Diaminobutyricimonas aerilata]|uniref:Putative membrane protein YeiB n=1 Tax=Diaminobutyricimonas aerilata TaxID=1162967 RepID=A0A2M9CL76_9MICO|nr:DUF418 domain-containing protein [Diaminobutyricimonas aerilata]PJJ72645.1 putative membrane protein YeiB [Diaminobutyricimonas aerilata]